MMSILALPNNDRLFIQSLIPQRDPFILVDTLYEYQPTHVKAGLAISADNIFLEDGFLAASGLIEHMAQSVALHTGYQYYINSQKPPTGYIGALKSIEIFELPAVGTSVVTKIDILHEILGVTLVAVNSYVGTQLIATGEMKTVIANS